MNELIPIENVSATELFAGDKLDDLLKKISEAAKSDSIDLETESGRKEIASRAYAVSRSKTTIDAAGKELTDEWKKKSKVIDAARKKARDYLDGLRDEVRRPLNEWESEKKRLLEEKARQEEERIAAKEEARRLEIERREAEIRKREEALLKAEREAAEKERAAEQERVRIEQEAAHKKEVAAAAEREKLAAIEREKQAKIDAEKAKEQAVREAEERVKREQEQREEEARLQQAEAERRAALIAKNKDNRIKINGAILSALASEGVSEDAAKAVISAVATGTIPHISIDYTGDVQ